MTLNLTLALSDVALLSGECWRHVSDLELDSSSFRCGPFLANAGGMFVTLNLTVALSDVTILSGKCWRYVSDLELDSSSFRCDHFVWQMLEVC